SPHAREHALPRIPPQPPHSRGTLPGEPGQARPGTPRHAPGAPRRGPVVPDHQPARRGGTDPGRSHRPDDNPGERRPDPGVHGWSAPAVPDYPRTKHARFLAHVSMQIPARWGALGPEAIRRRRTTAAGWLPGDEKAGDEDSAAR